MLLWGPIKHFFLFHYIADGTWCFHRAWSQNWATWPTTWWRLTSTEWRLAVLLVSSDHTNGTVYKSTEATFSSTIFLWLIDWSISWWIQKMYDNNDSWLCVIKVTWWLVPGYIFTGANSCAVFSVFHDHDDNFEFLWWIFGLLYTKRRT